MDPSVREFQRTATRWGDGGWDNHWSGNLTTWPKHQSNALLRHSSCWRRKTNRSSIAAVFPSQMCPPNCSVSGTMCSGRTMRSFAPSFRRASGLRYSDFIRSSSVCVGCFHTARFRPSRSSFSHHTGCSFLEVQQEHCRPLFQVKSSRPAQPLTPWTPSA